MDLHICFWDKTENPVKTFYWTSEFLGKASAEGVLLNYYQVISSLDENKILQISSDGSNVNLAFLNLLDKNRRHDELDPLINI